MFRKLYGRAGRIEIPAIGMLVGEMTEWTLTRREGKVPEDGIYTLRASFSFVHDWAIRNDAVQWTATVMIGNKGYIIERRPETKVHWDRGMLIMEGVNLCRE